MLPHQPHETALTTVQLHETAVDQAMETVASQQKLAELGARQQQAAGVLGRLFHRDPAKKLARTEGFRDVEEAIHHYTTRIHELPRAQVTPIELNDQMAALRSDLGQLPKEADTNIDIRVFQLDVPSNFKPQRGELSWPEWLSNPEKGVSDWQLLKIMQWDIQRVAQLEKKYLPEVDRSLKKFEAGVTACVKADVLDSALLDTPKNRTIRFAGLFDYVFDGGTDAYAVKSENLMVFDKRTPEISTVGHEDMHFRGGFAHRWWNESVTESLTRTVLTRMGAPVDTHAYYDHVIALQDILEASNIGTKELSRLFSGPDEKANLEALRNVARENTGVDIVTMVTETFEEAGKKYGRSDAEVITRSFAKSMKHALKTLSEPDFEADYRQVKEDYRQSGYGEESVLAYQTVYKDRDAILQARANKKK